MTLRALSLVLLLVIDAVLILRPSGGRVPVVQAPSEPVRAPVRWEDPLASLTADDVARGAWALNKQGPLPGDEGAALRPLLKRGADQHAKISAARMEARAARDVWMKDEAALAVALKGRVTGTLVAPLANPAGPQPRRGTP